MIEPSVVVVVVAFGHADRLAATLRSVASQQYPPDRIQLVVVDNGDGASAATARQVASSAIVLEPGRNLGFAGGCNLGVAQSDAPVVVLVNPDVELAPDFLRSVVAVLEQPGSGIVGGKLLFPDGATVQHAGGELLLPLALTNHRGHGRPDSPTFAEAAGVSYVTGAALALRRATWMELGGLDEAFFPAYFEEVDLCLRARAAGSPVRYLPEAVATHAESSSLGGKSGPYYRLYHANRLRLLFKHWDDRWLTVEWLPAELRHLRTTADDNEIDSLLWAYHRWQAHFLGGGSWPDLRLDAQDNQPLDGEAPQGSELAWTLAQARAKRVVTPQPFRSRLPLLARARRWMNSLATEEYLRPLIQQQNDFNATMVELTAALERQRRTADGAVLCQGMLLAKIFACR